MRRITQLIKLGCAVLCLTWATANHARETSPQASVEKADFVLVEKSKYRLTLFKNGKSIGEYAVVFGGNPVGHKQQQGDEKTPEGRYTIDNKNPHSKFYKSLHISYPNAADRARAKARGVSPGGDIMVHGQKNGWGSLTLKFNWTLGCIALSNKDMDAAWARISVPVPIEIKP